MIDPIVPCLFFLGLSGVCGNVALNKAREQRLRIAAAIVGIIALAIAAYIMFQPGPMVRV